MEEYVVRDGKRLRLGYTTGSCAAAAAKAAAWMLLTGKPLQQISLLTPRGIRLQLQVEQITAEPEAVSCAIRKDGGDDPDMTHGTLIFARVSRTDTPGITVDGGVGVGRVTRQGLDQSVGSAAINSVPRQMILENTREVCRTADYHGGLQVIISVPEGEALAKKTFNPRLGIEGGISILGTTGIVEPMSDRALVDTVRVELRQRRAGGQSLALLTPGNYGSDFTRLELGIPGEIPVQVSNFIGDGLDICRELGFRGVLLVGHIGKLVKLAGGMLNTHSRYGDCRMEILGVHGAMAGLDPERLRELMQCVACDGALGILQQAGLLQRTMETLTEKICFHLRHRAGDLPVEVLIFSREYGILGQSSGAQALLKQITEEEKWYIS